MTSDEAEIIGWATNEEGERALPYPRGDGGGNPYRVHNKGTLSRMMANYREKIDTTRRTFESNSICSNSGFLVSLEPKNVKLWQAQKNKGAA